MFARNLRNPRAADPALDKKELGFPWHYIYLPRVARAGNLTGKNLAKTALCPKASVYPRDALNRS